MGDVAIAPRALFWDVGGVLLSNAWDRGIRRRAVAHFQLDWEEFEDRHELVVPAFEKGQLTLDEYLDRTVFYRARLFTKESFREWICAQSTPQPESLALVERLARTKKYVMGTLNNESAELNEYRIRRFHLRNYFAVFLSSCYLGVRKPDAAMYRLAMQLAQCEPHECIFVDDRPLNVECARRAGMHAIQFENAGRLEPALRQLGVDW
ncbi:MAG TPA: HAD family phosphatase [Bryobacterales bacterium]|jgi:putative hydrolase of the HAD superfamily|nr:HAD family phosphatase [Bryobacterales bacterium]